MENPVELRACLEILRKKTSEMQTRLELLEGALHKLVERVPRLLLKDPLEKKSFPAPINAFVGNLSASASAGGDKDGSFVTSIQNDAAGCEVT